jgi:hypothetical protein
MLLLRLSGRWEENILMRMLILCVASSAMMAADPDSPLRQIDRSNVAKLQTAWTYHTGALDIPGEANRKAAFESTPILADGVLYLSTSFPYALTGGTSVLRNSWATWKPRLYCSVKLLPGPYAG